MIGNECKKHYLRINKIKRFKSIKKKKHFILRKYKKKLFLNGYQDLKVNKSYLLIPLKQQQQQQEKKTLKFKPYFLTLDQVINRVAKRANNPKILTKLIFFISLLGKPILFKYSM